MFTRSVLRLLTAFGLAGSLYFAQSQTLESHAFRAVLSSANEVPAIEGLNASGSALVWIHVVRSSSGTITEAVADFQVRYTFPGPITVTGLHIHSGIAGQNGPVLIDTGLRAGAEDPTGTAGVVRQTARLTTAAQIAAINGLLANQADYYVNLHTTVNPGGAIRGQAYRATVDVIAAQMNAANEVPAITGLNATGTGLVTVIAARNAAGAVQSGQVTFDVAYTGFPEGTNFTGLHVHAGAAGANGGVVLDSALRGPVAAAASGTGSLRFTNHFDAPNANAVAAMNGLNGTAPGGWYVNLHTTVNPGGAIRGQALRTESFTISNNMTPGAEVPPIDSTNSATSRFTMHLIRDSKGIPAAGLATFGVFHRFPEDTTFTGLHIHAAPAGQNGGVVINSALTGQLPSATGVGHVLFMNPVTGGAALTALQGLVLNPENYYINIHTTVSPGGAVRAQLSGPLTDGPAITRIGRLASTGEIFDLVQPGSTFVIDGTSLAKVGGAAFSVVDGTPQTSLNGTSVTVGGFAAEIVSVDRSRITARVPASINLGPVPVRAFPVIVTTANGSSSVGNVIVSVQAPSPN